MARVAAADGIETIVATPHVSYDYPTDPAENRRAGGGGQRGAGGRGDRVDGGGGSGGRALAAPRDRQAAPAQACVGRGRTCSWSRRTASCPTRSSGWSSSSRWTGSGRCWAHVERCPGVGSKPGAARADGGAGGGLLDHRVVRDRALRHKRSATSRATCSGEGWFTTWPRTLMGRVGGRRSCPASREAVERDAAVQDVWEWVTSAVPRPWWPGPTFRRRRRPAPPPGGRAAWRRVMRSGARRAAGLNARVPRGSSVSSESARLCA